jgi:hypothetical protein
MAHDVFISHSSEDKAIADAACARLETRGLRCWIAPRDVVPGATYPSEIRRGIADCRVFLAVYTAAFNQSEETLAEVHRAVKDGKYVIPFRIEDVQMRVDMEHFLSTRHWLDAMTPPLEAHLDRLAGVIEHVLKGDDARPLPPTARTRTARPGAKLLIGIVLTLMLITSALAWVLRPAPLPKDPRIDSRVGQRLDALAAVPQAFALSELTPRLSAAKEEWQSISHAEWNRASASNLASRLSALEQEVSTLENAKRAAAAQVPQAPAAPAILVAEFTGEPTKPVVAICDEISLRFRVRNAGATTATAVAARVTSVSGTQIHSTSPEGRAESDGYTISLPDLPPGSSSGEFTLAARPHGEGIAAFRVSPTASDSTSVDAVASVHVGSPHLTLTPTLRAAAGTSYEVDWTVANVGNLAVESCEVSCGGVRKRLQALSPGERGTLSFIATPDPETREVLATLAAPCLQPFTESVITPEIRSAETAGTSPVEPQSPASSPPPAEPAAKSDPTVPDPSAAAPRHQSYFAWGAGELAPGTFQPSPVQSHNPDP